MFKHNFLDRLVKTITIREKVYDKLAAVKGENESFSDLLERLVNGSDPVKTLKRLRGVVEFRNKEELLTEIQNLRTARRA